MEKLVEAIDRTVEYHKDVDPDWAPAAVVGLQKAATDFATMALVEFRDELLKKGLAVSVALADFVAEYRESIKTPIK